MVARLVASSVDDVSCSAAWLRQVLMMLGGPSRTRAREYCGSGRYLVGSGWPPSVVLARIFMGPLKRQRRKITLSSVDATEKNTKSLTDARREKLKIEIALDPPHHPRLI